MMRRTLLATALATICPLGIAQAKSNADLPLDEIRNFVDVYNTIRNEYVEEKNGKKLIDFAIEGMLNGLDPNSVYLRKSQLEEVKDDTSGSYVGFGVQLDMADGKLIIVSPIPGSPADEAGLQPSDHVIKLGDTVIENMSLPEVSKILKQSDTVVFTVKRKDEEVQQITVTKTTVSLPSVAQKLLDKQYGYIRINQFQIGTAKQFEVALDELLDKNIKGLVIDLRNNPGGLVATATSIADLFLDAGLIVSTKNQNTGTEEKIHATIEVKAKELPLVVLINEGSASASELLAGALQSHKRAVVVGQKSFGKGSVQEIMPLDNGNAIKLTVARYYTPNGKSIQAKGITPDITLSQLTVDDKNQNPLMYGEADIPKHLNNDTQKLKKKPRNNNVTHLAKSDLQLFEAMNVLKVLIFKQ